MCSLTEYRGHYDDKGITMQQVFIPNCCQKWVPHHGHRFSGETFVEHLTLAIDSAEEVTLLDLPLPSPILPSPDGTAFQLLAARNAACLPCSSWSVLLRLSWTMRPSGGRV